jgi:protein-S-isoprenylcysteine O-methyltransferase Ste14
MEVAGTTQNPRGTETGVPWQLRFNFRGKMANKFSSQQWFVIVLVSLVCATLFVAALVITGHSKEAVGLGGVALGCVPLILIIWGMLRDGRTR